MQGVASNEGEVVISDLTVIYQTSQEAVEAVRGFDLTAEPGQLVCVLGPSGCGKSTLLNVVAGFIVPTKGCVTVDGQTVGGPGPDRGMVFQHYVLFPWKTVLGNVEFGPKMQGIPKRERHEVAVRFIDLVGLSGFESKYPHELSGGMQQRVGIARILAANPNVMLMDEPFGAVDSQTRSMLQELLLDVWTECRTTILFVTHDVDEALFISDTIYVMTARPGQVKDVIRNSLPRPRSADLRTSAQFTKMKRHVLKLIREEFTLRT